MPLHVYLGACVGWDVRPAQARLLHHGQDIADPVGELCLVIDPAQYYTIQPHGSKVHEPIDNLLRGTNEQVTTPARAAQTLARACSGSRTRHRLKAGPSRNNVVES